MTDTKRNSLGISETGVPGEGISKTESLEDTLKWCIAQPIEPPKISSASLIAGTWLFLIIASAAAIYLSKIKRRS